MVVLDEYGALAAESRLTQEPKVWQQALALEDTYRTHSRSTQPQVRRGDNRFRLEPLIEVLRQSAPAEADQYS